MTTWIIAVVVAAIFGAAGYVVGMSRGKSIGHEVGFTAATRGDLVTKMLAGMQEQAGNLQEAQQRVLAAVGERGEQVLSQALTRIQEADERRRKELAERRREDSEAALQRLDNSIREPIEKGLARLTHLTNEASQKSQRAYGATIEAARNIEQQVSDVSRSAHSLRDALKGDRQARGRWGEIQLERAVEIAGLQERVNFERQQAQTSNGGRPDMVLHLPHGAALAVDAKAPMDNYLRALEEDGNEARAALFRKHAEDLRNHVRGLSRRKYHEALKGPAYTVLFLPLESLLSEAVRADSSGLLQFAADQKVVLTTPHSLLAILWGVASMWQQAESSKNADAIRNEAEKLHQRIGTFLQKFGQLGKVLGKAVDGYNASVASAESRMLPSIRRIAEMRGVEPPADGVSPQVEARPRVLAAPPQPAADPETPQAPRGPAGPVPRRLGFQPGQQTPRPEEPMANRRDLFPRIPS